VRGRVPLIPENACKPNEVLTGDPDGEDAAAFLRFGPNGFFRLRTTQSHKIPRIQYLGGPVMDMYA
jgi:hypothetical protein